ncbi:hypothetical protein XENOCAPTIV_025099 [Xenoophorus captivus]|uniref:Mitochondrial ribosomal protein L1 n=1 Tax=Xenoophorus captivus TaxID=1517983 RepID=A0ABV0QKQ7_9TELE
MDLNSRLRFDVLTHSSMLVFVRVGFRFSAPNLCSFQFLLSCSVLSGCQKQLLSAGGPTYTAVFQTAPRNLPIRTFAAVKTQKKDKQEEAKKEVKKEKKLIDDKDRHKPFGKTAWVPVDDVYVKRFYPRTIHSAADTINMLKRFQELDFTPADQPVYIDLKLDMKLEKKTPLQFSSTESLIHVKKTSGFPSMVLKPARTLFLLS